jgi:hypothetical protein
VYIQLLGKVDVSAMKKCTDEERMIKFHIQEVIDCRSLTCALTPCIVMD